MSALLKQIQDSHLGKSFNRIKRSKHFQRGLPFFIFVIGSPFLLKHLASVRYEYRNQTAISKEQEKILFGGNSSGHQEKSLEEIYEETVKNTPDDYENIRGPRPWEEDSAELKKQKEEIKVKSEKASKRYKEVKEVLAQKQALRRDLPGGTGLPKY